MSAPLNDLSLIVNSPPATPASQEEREAQRGNQRWCVTLTDSVFIAIFTNVEVLDERRKLEEIENDAI